jgi:ribokinase
MDFLAIGDIVTDAFIRLTQADILDSVDHTRKELCVTFGDKVPYESVKVVKAVGNSANAAVAAARLGLSSALDAAIGDDEYGREMIESLKTDRVATEYISINQGMVSNYHYVLWYDTQRTILVKHEAYPRKMPNLPQKPKWIYLSSLGENTIPFHKEIADYLNANPDVKLAFQPGTFQMKMGVEALKDIYARSDIFFCNKEEAQRILKSEVSDIKTLSKSIKNLGPKIVVITDDLNGAYAYDGTDTWFMGIYPHTPIEKTGAGDAFASTLTSAIALGKSLEEALTWGPINSMSVVQKVGAQEGLLSREKLEEYLRNAPADYKPRKI